MILTDYFYPERDLTWDYAVQCGVSHGVIRLPENKDFRFQDRQCWQNLCDRFRSAGIQPLVVEPLPNCLHDHIKAGDTKRDESIDTFIRMLPLMREQGITTVCMNFMAHVGWTRTTSRIPERGGALVTGFNQADYVPTEAAITPAELWENWRVFVEAVIPEAEKNEIRLALHPDDPPLAKLGNVSRIMISLENIEKAINIHPSECLGVTFCQAVYQTMGENLEEAVRRLADRIFFIHFRNCTGKAECFHETFHDNGEIDMARMIALYTRYGLNVPIRVDHVPQMAGLENTDNRNLPAGYSALGRLYAIGYLKGLLEMQDCLSK